VTDDSNVIMIEQKYDGVCDWKRHGSLLAFWRFTNRIIIIIFKCPKMYSTIIIIIIHQTDCSKFAERQPKSPSHSLQSRRYLELEAGFTLQYEHVNEKMVNNSEFSRLTCSMDCPLWLHKAVRADRDLDCTT